MHTNDIDAENYALFNHLRNNKRGGGIALIHINKYSVKHLAIDFKPKTFEYAVFDVRSLFTILDVYRPPPLKTREGFIIEI